ncbi:dicarboxylate/amino acid:cation symporter [Chitinophaga sancti]|uniref:Dicarboxylate/amino acid:cation symporter n=1 Tax=Chitinophaga sancti TaxID=1004 RepID=A0A1K1NDE2_9BACT|nr:dicarboxylate/amino acid:cation symporter [Chitinophaga sancti]WQD63308.1 dicarboxylate/amino acid:cation symporter [Chitinophaga sancti]WQG91066.1 dicarboxylate/amino acid:cation symporter [Chitinophaga sancti]SFW33363.1 Na+/H+-dicarboxylate symporter [Chitinophaga sancti]
MRQLFKNYSSILLLLGGIITGSIMGLSLGKQVLVLKPIGDIFLNLIFIAVVPLVFFAISAAIANIDPGQKLGKIMSAMGLVFLSTILISAFCTIVVIWFFPLEAVVSVPGTLPEMKDAGNWGNQVVRLLTTEEFFSLLSRKNMLPLLIFAAITGFATLKAGEEGIPFRNFLVSANAVMKRFLDIIMVMAPLGLGVYFACQIAELGPQLFVTYASSMKIYYGFGIIYFVLGFSIYAFIAGGWKGILYYWRYNIVPTLTALGSCSSIATIPANLEAAKKMRVPEAINNVVVPLGATLHKDGSSISSIVKIGVVFALFGRDFSGVDTILLALGITVIVSIVEGGVPNGGYIGELLVMSVYGFPVAALPAVMIVGTLVDPLATVLNATGDSVAAMLVTRVLKGKNWIREQEAELTK